MALNFGLMTPTVELEVTAEGAGDNATCKIGFRAVSLSRSKELLDKRDQISEAAASSGFSDPVPMQEFLREGVVYITDFPIVDDDGTVVFLVDTRSPESFSRIHEMFDSSEDFSSAEKRKDSLLTHAVFQSLAWSRAANLAHIYALQNIKPLSSSARLGN